ncbi:Inner membrane protein YqiK [Salmonella enterica subsp. enterica serovar Typhi]|nr:Inner membrane protein YqiK [Salmonella enterica subsp. enterica serovar Typhi]
MDDVFGILPSWMFTAIVAVIVLLIMVMLPTY